MAFALAYALVIAFYWRSDTLAPASARFLVLPFCFFACRLKLGGKGGEVTLQEYLNPSLSLHEP